MTTPISQRGPYVLVALRDRDSFLAAMKARSMSVRKLASAADVGFGTVGHLVSGSRNQCLQGSAERIARALNVPMEVLFRPGRPLGRQPRQAPEAAHAA